MKNSKMLILTVAAMTFAVNAQASHSPIDLGQFVTGTHVDKDGRNLLQVFAAECDNDNFTVSVKPFELPEKIVQDNIATFARWGSYQTMPQELVQVIIMDEMIKLTKAAIEGKDNNGDTALGILNKKNSSHPRCHAIKKMCEDATELLNQQR
jgi:hypothetical protein